MHLPANTYTLPDVANVTIVDEAYPDQVQRGDACRSTCINGWYQYLSDDVEEDMDPSNSIGAITADYYYSIRNDAPERVHGDMEVCTFRLLVHHHVPGGLRRHEWPAYGEVDQYLDGDHAVFLAIRMIRWRIMGSGREDFSMLPRSRSRT